MIKYNLSIPELDKKDVISSMKAIKSGWISTAGKDVKKFEKQICKKVKARYAIALNSGTSAIHLALAASKVTNGDEVMVQSLTYVATINPILYLGASPIFFDVDDRFNMKIDDVIEFLKVKTFFSKNNCINRKTKKIIKAIIITHLWGSTQNLVRLKKICKERNIAIIEDAAEAFGTRIRYGKKLINAGCQANLGCYSFNGNKIITTGSGGAVVTNNKKYYDYINYLATQSKNNSFSYLHDEIGFNYKLNNLLSCLGISQLKKLELFIKKKKNIHKQYINEFKNFNGVNIFQPSQNILSNYWFNIATFKKIDKIRLKKLKNFCLKNKIEIRQVWRPAHKQKYLNKYQTYKITNSIKLYNNSICLPSSLKLNIKDLNFISKKIKFFYNNFLKKE